MPNARGRTAALSVRADLPARDFDPGLHLKDAPWRRRGQSGKKDTQLQFGLLGCQRRGGPATSRRGNVRVNPRVRICMADRAAKTRKTLAWVGGVLGALITVTLLALALINWNAMKRPIERFASARAGRPVTIAGNLEVHLWSWAPRVSVEGLNVGNQPWEQGQQPMMHVEKLEVQLKLLPLLKGDVILARVELRHPEVYLHRDTSGRANWTFENTKPTNAPTGKPPKLPVVRDFLIDDGKLVVHDEILKLSLDGTIEAREQASKADPKAFRIEGKGTLNERLFWTQIAGGPLINLDPDHPYPFDVRIEAGDIRVAASGSVRKPFDLGRVSLDVTASGSDLADVYYLTQLALPNTPPYKLSLHIDREVSQIRVTDMQGTVGKSDVGGDLLIDISRKRPSVSGHLQSKRLALADMAAPLGGQPKSRASVAQAAEKPNPSNRGKEQAAPADSLRLFPTARLQVARVRGMDADVKFRARSIEAGSLPLKEVAFDVRLDNGLLSVDPLAFEMDQGKLSGSIRIDARSRTPRTKLDLRIRDMQLDQLKGKAPDAKPPLGGVLQAHAVLEGVGDSVHDFVADANGQVSAVVPHGQVNAAFAELTGIDVSRGLGLLLKGNNDRTEVRCGVAQFAVEKGTMNAQTLVFDTTEVKITGQGKVELGPEMLDLSIKGDPKKLRFTRLRTPIEIGGHLRKPSIGINAGKTVAQGAVAVALGATLSPFAAILAFIDPGLAKDENCAALISNSPVGPTKTASQSDRKTPARR